MYKKSIFSTHIIDKYKATKTQQAKFVTNVNNYNVNNYRIQSD